MARIYTRTGDAGETSLIGGARVPKHHLRMEAIGAVDEANAAIGLARCHTRGDEDTLLARIQHELFDLGADLAARQDKAGAARIEASQVERLEREIDHLTAHLPPLTAFILPGGNEAAARVHLARTIVRRAERGLTALHAAEPINVEALRYLNRLSDLLFMLARRLNDGSDVLWQQGANR